MSNHFTQLTRGPISMPQEEKRKQGCSCGGGCSACAAARAAEVQGAEELEHAEHLAPGMRSLADIPVDGAFSIGMGAGRAARDGTAPGHGAAIDLARMLGGAGVARQENTGGAPQSLPLHARSGRGPIDVSHPGDAAEREVERIVHRLFPDDGVRWQAEHRAQPGGSAGGEHRLEAFGGMAGHGSALPEATRSEMETVLGADLSDVRVHTDANAAVLSESLHANAFAYGNDVFFGAGKFAPGTRGGDRLLAHELTHTVQHRSAGPTIARDGERRTTLQCVNENLSSAGVASWLLAIVGTTCGLIGAFAGSPTGPGAAGTAALAAATCIAAVVGFSVGFVLGILTGCMNDPNFRSGGANPR